MDALRKKYDKENLYDVIVSLPDQFLNAFDDTQIAINKNTANIIFCGMGGSAWPADLFQTYLNVEKIKLGVRIKVNRDYSLPTYVDKSWCGFFSSYSGNTEETLSALKQAEKIGLKKIVVLAHGGKLAEIAKKKGYAYVKIPDFSQPRMAYGYYIGALLKIFVNSGLIKFNLTNFKKDIANVKKSEIEIQSLAKKLAKLIKGKTPLIYSSNLWQEIALVWKINLNENSKTTAFANVIPEMNHNEINGFVKAIGKYQVIIIKDGSEHKQILKRIETLEKVLAATVPVGIITMPNGTAGYKMVATLWLGLYASYYLALEYGIDPTPVALVEQFKLLLQK